MNKCKLKYHIILVTKYRKKILDGKIMSFIIDVIKEKMKSHKCNIITIRGDNMDHIHIMIELMPSQSVSSIVKLIKQYTTYYSWKMFPTILRKAYWYKNVIWSNGYFCCSTGDASSETIERYINSQGDWL